MTKNEWEILAGHHLQCPHVTRAMHHVLYIHCRVLPHPDLQPQRKQTTTCGQLVLRLCSHGWSLCLALSGVVFVHSSEVTSCFQLLVAACY